MVASISQPPIQPGYVTPPAVDTTPVPPPPAPPVLDTDTTLDHIAGGTGQSGVTGLASPRETSDASASRAAQAMANYGTTEMQGDMMAFMALFQELAQTMRDSNRNSRNAETQAQVASLNSAADKIVAAADLRYSAAQLQANYAIAASAVSIGVSVVQIGMAGYGAYKSYQGSKQLSMGDSMKTEAASLTGSNTRLQAGMLNEAGAVNLGGTKLTAQGGVISGTGMALTGVNQGITGMIKGFGDKAAAEEEKDASYQDSLGAKDQADAKMHEAASQNAADVAQAMQDIIRDIRDKVQAIEQAQVDTNKAIARNV